MAKHAHRWSSRPQQPAPPQVAVTSVEVSTVLQPIIDLHTGAVAGYEALARFEADQTTPVLDRFVDAHAQGVGADLEAACLRAARRRRVDVAHEAWLSMNVSPDVLGHPQIQHALAGDLSGIVIEITEQPDSDIEELSRALVALRERGALIAVDDASTGHAGLLRLIRLRPDFVKLDASLVAALADQVEQSAVIEALVTLSRRIGARVLGEGVETVDDLRALADLDVDYAQGWVIAHPASEPPVPTQHSVTACRIARRDLLRGTTTTSDQCTADTDHRAMRLHRITSALAASLTVDDLQACLERAAVSLNVDVIAVSTHSCGQLHEVATHGAAKDHTMYPLAAFPATRSALDTDTATEIQADDQTADRAERQLLTDRNLASVLIVPLTRNGQPVGILELSHRNPHRWSSSDIAHVKTLAEHVTPTLQRITSIAAPHGQTA